jgi:flagellar protein FlaF
MGFSVSGAAAIVFAGMFVAFGMFYTATAGSTERISEAESDHRDRALDQQNTALSMVEATYYAANDSLIVQADNTGTTSLSVGETDLLVDNAYTTDANVTVDGNATTALWLPGERVRYTVSADSQPGRVKLVTETGVAGTEVVTSG